MSVLNARRVLWHGAVAVLSGCLVFGAAGCANRHTAELSTAVSVPPSGSSQALSSLPSTAAPLLATGPISSPAGSTASSRSAEMARATTWPPITTLSPTGDPPTLQLSNGDAAKTYAVGTGTVIDVTVQLRSGDGVSIDPPSSGNPNILEQVSADSAPAAITHGVFRATAPGDAAIVVIENPPPQPCPSGGPSPCVGVAPRGFDFFVTIVAAKS